MNRLEIFQEVYGKDYVFTETELSRLQQVAELIVRECAETAASCFVGWPMDGREQRHTCSNAIKKHFGVE